MSKKKVILFSLIFALTASFGGNIATPMADTIKEQKAQKKKLEKKRAKEAEKIEKLKAQKVEIEYIRLQYQDRQDGKDHSQGRSRDKGG